MTHQPLGNVSAAPQAAAAYVVHRTVPSEILRHDISDDELSRLCETRAGFMADGMWACIGAFLGALPGAATALGKYSGSADRTLGVVDLVQVLICAVALVLGAVLALLVAARAKSGESLQDQIRKRTRTVAP